ncbi:MAG: hypothetical protein FWC34_07600, partial [Bacteroidetes bacterium]|nr:hypothetical protein [Bacteroidota bacterium]
MNKFYSLRLSLLVIAMFGLAFSTNLLHAQHLFSVNYNNISKENVALLKNQIAKSEISTLSLTKNNENKDVYPVALSSEENTKIVILNEQNGNNVVITPAVETRSIASLQLAPFFIEELRQGELGNANHYLIMETTADFSVKNVSSVSATKRSVHIPRYLYGKKEDIKEAFPKDRQIVHIFKEKPRLIAIPSEDPEFHRYIAQLEEKMSYYVYMYKLPDGGLWIYDEHFNIDNDESVTKAGSNLQFNLSGNLTGNSQTATLHALGIWSEVLAGTVPVDINVQHINMGGGGVIGGSYRTPNYWDPITQAWYCSALGNQMSGFNNVPSQRDIRLEMNSQFNFYYGITGNPGGSQIDWITVMLHEVCHGLGFYPLVGSNGAYSYTTPSGGSSSTSSPGIYDIQLYQGATGNTRLVDLTQSQRASLVTSNNLYSGAPGSNLLAANGGERVRMYAPTSWASGSSVSHWNTTVTFPTFMKHQIAYGFKLHTIGTRKIGMMLDIGWTQPQSMVPVTNITGVATTATVSLPLTLSGTVVPSDATNKTIAWSIQNVGTTGATLTGNTLNTTAAGTVIVRATITNGAGTSTDYTKDFTITVSKAQLAGTVAITGNTIFGQTLTASTSGLTAEPLVSLGTLSYEWKRNNVPVGANASNYTLVQADIDSTLTVTVTAANCNGSITSVATATVTKATQTAPTAPTLSSSTATSIILNTIDGCEYRRAGGAWQT